MINKNKTTEDFLNKIQNLKGKTKLKFCQNISNFYGEMNYRRQCGCFEFEEDPFAENFQGITEIYHEVILLKNFLHTT